MTPPPIDTTTAAVNDEAGRCDGIHQYAAALLRALAAERDSLAHQVQHVTTALTKALARAEAAESALAALQQRLKDAAQELVDAAWNGADLNRTPETSEEL